MNAESLVERTIFEIAPLIEKGEVSPLELTEAMIARIKAIDPKIGSYLLITEALALEQAAQNAAQTVIIARRHMVELVDGDQAVVKGFNALLIHNRFKGKAEGGVGAHQDAGL